jgi:hypothetical protein
LRNIVGGVLPWGRLKIDLKRSKSWLKDNALGAILYWAHDDTEARGAIPFPEKRGA